MSRLVIYPSFMCPFSCNFCMTKNRNSLNELLDLDYLRNFMEEHKNNISEIIISGGEPLALDVSYFIQLLNTITIGINKPVVIKSYPFTKPFNVTSFNNVSWDFSYDFTVRPRALEAWDNLYQFEQPFKVTVTLSPMIFKLYPNAILHKLNLLPNINAVEFVPYYKNECSEYDITKNDSLFKFNQLILSTKLNLKYRLINKEKLINHMVGEYDICDICILPDGKVVYKQIEDDKLVFKPVESKNPFERPIFLNNSSSDLYDGRIIEWAKENGIV